MQEDSGNSQCFQSFYSVLGQRERDGSKERTKLRTSQIYCRVSNFRLPTYLSETLIKKKLVCKKEGWTLAKSARAQRGRRLRAIDLTSIRRLCAAIDQTGERPGEPEHTAPNQNEMENNFSYWLALSTQFRSRFLFWLNESTSFLLSSTDAGDRSPETWQDTYTHTRLHTRRPDGPRPR
ncbi:unnamed protein product [Leuciscus chuanchicus]